MFKNPIERMMLSKRHGDNLNKKVCVWDHQFSYLQYKNNGLCIKPRVNLVTTVGFGNDATHSKENSIDRKFYGIKKYSLGFPLIHPKKVQVNQKISQKRI